MIRKAVTVNSNKGLEIREIALLVHQASQYRSQVFIETPNKKINAKSIMGVMSLQLAKGDGIVVMADGEDEQAVIEGMESFFAF